jgi:hypothetical protein
VDPVSLSLIAGGTAAAAGGASALAGAGIGATIAGGVLSAYGDIFGGKAQAAQYKYQAGVAQQEAYLAKNVYTPNAITSAGTQAYNVGMKGAEIVGQERLASALETSPEVPLARSPPPRPNKPNEPNPTSTPPALAKPTANKSKVHSRPPKLALNSLALKPLRRLPRSVLEALSSGLLDRLVQPLRSGPNTLTLRLRIQPSAL